MTDLTPEDIAAARREGDLVALLLMSAGLTPAPVPKQRTTEPETDNVHIAHPGAWPTGASRPTPVPPPTAPQIDAAVDDYRRWLVADRPPASTKCPCAGCTP
ncbi:hypothetical protein [Streptomyces sp. WM4235]|uniref:hypothetical protein n=1 Tax=Streptomyces sp. WM4235 TaxID=1415551 RepID=UPI0006AE6FBE|nr:hypothetical protein [Streptomyces sp. WM4235]